jgi:hypothetical protein
MTVKFFSSGVPLAPKQGGTAEESLPSLTTEMEGFIFGWLPLKEARE